jgi:hypothetical protein
MATAWFRVHVMGDTANREYFYGSNCNFCTDSRVQVAQNSLMLHVGWPATPLAGLGRLRQVSGKCGRTFPIPSQPTHAL